MCVCVCLCVCTRARAHAHTREGTVLLHVNVLGQDVVVEEVLRKGKREGKMPNYSQAQLPSSPVPDQLAM